MARNIPDEARLVLTGTVTLQSADALHAQLLEMADHPVVEIDCSAVTDTDLGLVQLILGARASTRKTGHSVVLAQPASGALLEILRRGGFIDTDVDHSDSEQAFWLQAAEV